MKPFAQLTFCCSVAVLAVFAESGAVMSQPPKPKDGPLGMKFVALPKGMTYLGWYGPKGSAKKTEIKADFEIAIYTVTQGQWQELMGKNPSWFSRDGGAKDRVKDIKDDELKQFPVENVSWDDCQEFIKKLNEKEEGKGYAYRLPTADEWEYACRGGAKTEEECSYNFYFAKPTNELSSKQANYDGSVPFDHAGSVPFVKGPNLGRTTKVGSYTPNKVGLYDMHGNVWQWTDSLHEVEASHRVLRGGSWMNRGVYCMTAQCDGRKPSSRDAHLGFRLSRIPLR